MQDIIEKEKPLEADFTYNPNDANFYDDPEDNYLEYWNGRDYEKAAEEIVLRQILTGRHFRNALDVGGGFGRLSRVLLEFADEVILLEPSEQQLERSEEYLKGENVMRIKGQAKRIPIQNNSIELAIMVRVMHHLPNPLGELKQVYDKLLPGGTLILEFANASHFKNKIKYGLRMKRTPRKFIDVRSEINRAIKSIPFGQHDPKEILTLVESIGFKLKDKYSVSNFRSGIMKKIVKPEKLLELEKSAQMKLAKLDFGPSIFYVLEK